MGIPHQVFVHEGPLRSLEQAARERNQQPEQVIRSLVFRLAEGAYVMVLVAGPAQVNWKALRKYLGQSRLTTASEEEVLAVTGYSRGAVAPFGLPQPLRILADESVFARPELSLGSGVRGTAIILSRANLKRALGDVEVGQFT
jgi:Cys-tRNA(Pro) deacylase